MVAISLMLIYYYSSEVYDLMVTLFCYQNENLFDEFIVMDSKKPSDFINNFFDNIFLQKSQSRKKPFLG